MNTAEKELLLKQDFDEVYEAGKTAQEKEWWTKYQTERNKRTGYHYAFAGWDISAYKPMLKINVLGADYMYRNFGGSAAPIDLVELHKELGIPDIDWSTATLSCYSTFTNSKISRLGVINLSKASHGYFFNNASYLITVDEVTLNPSGNWVNLFAGCSKLANIKFGGSITKDLSFSDSPLTLESAADVIEHLENYAGTDKEGTYTITFSTATWGLLDADSGIEVDGTAYTWRAYIQSIGWNC